MLNGTYSYTAQDGSQQVHEILQYVDRADPLGPYPANPSADPQYANWDWPVVHTYGTPSINTGTPTHTGFPSPSPTP